MKCKYCGTDNKTSKVYCVQCGREFEFVSDKSTLEEDLLVNLFQEDNMPEDAIDDFSDEDISLQSHLEYDDNYPQEHEEYDDSDKSDYYYVSSHRLTRLVTLNAVIVCILVAIVLLYFYFR